MRSTVSLVNLSGVYHSITEVLDRAIRQLIYGIAIRVIAVAAGFGFTPRGAKAGNKNRATTESDRGSPLISRTTLSRLTADAAYAVRPFRS